jgi:hypothetical protein
MTVLLLSFAVMLIAVLGLSLGVLLGRRPIQGSCGGIGGRCGACSRSCREQGAAGECEQRD